VIDDAAAFDRLRGLDRPLGGEARELAVGERAVRIVGLDERLADELERRWGGFLRPPAATAPDRTLRVLDAGSRDWLPEPEFGEQYRIEARNDLERRVVVSYHFAICRESDPGVWRVGITLQDVEPLQRVVDNAARYVAASLALEDGGFAMHGATVLRDGRAFVFAGPSGSGKTTATRLAQPARSLGDDFAMVTPGPEGWTAPALPFDNSERVPDDAVRGVYPVSAIWRLEQAERTRLGLLSPSMAVASLIGCAAFPWAMPEEAERLLAHVRRFVEQSCFRKLYFSKEEPLWTHLL